MAVDDARVLIVSSDNSEHHFSVQFHHGHVVQMQFLREPKCQKAGTCVTEMGIGREDLQQVLKSCHCRAREGWVEQPGVIMPHFFPLIAAIVAGSHDKAGHRGGNL